MAKLKITPKKPDTKWIPVKITGKPKIKPWRKKLAYK